MEIRLNGAVDCAYSTCGHVSRIVVHPRTPNVTDIVVRDRHWPHIERLVPLELVEDTNRDGVALWCRDEQWRKLRPFYRTQTSEAEVPVPSVGHEQEHPHLTQQKAPTIYVKQMLPGQVDIGEHTRITVEGQSVGRLAEVLTDMRGRITHLVIRTGRPWARQERIVDGDQIATITRQTIALTLVRQQMNTLSILPTHHYRTAVPT